MRRARPQRMRQARAMGRRDLTNLARYEPQAAAVEGLPERSGNLASAVPAQFHDGRLFTRKPKCARKASPARARVKDNVAFAWRPFGQRKARAEGACKLRAFRRN